MTEKTGNNFFRFNRKIKLNEGNLFSAKNIKIQILNLKNEVRINTFKITLIFFYEILSQENIDLYNRLKLEVLGSFFGVKDINILMKLFRKIKYTNTPFILISTGSSYEKINDICSNFLQYIIIFCFNKQK